MHVERNTSVRSFLTSPFLDTPGITISNSSTDSFAFYATFLFAIVVNLHSWFFFHDDSHGWWFMIGKAKMIQLIHSGWEKKLFLSLDVARSQSVSVLQSRGMWFFNNNDSTMRRVKLKIRKYKVGDIKFCVKLSPQIESGLSERIELDTGFVKVIMEVVWKILWF